MGNPTIRDTWMRGHRSRFPLNEEGYVAKTFAFIDTSVLRPNRTSMIGLCHHCLAAPEKPVTWHAHAFPLIYLHPSSWPTGTSPCWRRIHLIREVVIASQQVKVERDCLDKEKKAQSPPSIHPSTLLQCWFCSVDLNY